MFDLHRYVFDDTYTNVIKSKLYGEYKVKHEKDGLIDTIHHLLSNCDNNNRRFLELLLKAFLNELIYTVIFVILRYYSYCSMVSVIYGCKVNFIFIFI